jgi:hypothetical protein
VALVALGAAAAAAPDLAACAREADSLGEALLRIRASEALARAELARGRARAAEEPARRALRAAERYGWEAGLYRLQALLGRVLESTGDDAGALAAHRESARSVARLRQGLPGELRSSFDALRAVREVEAWAAAHPNTASR